MDQNQKSTPADHQDPVLGLICPLTLPGLARDFLRPPEEIPPRYHVRGGFRPLRYMMQLYQCHIIIHLSKYIQTTDSTGRFALLWPGEDLCRQIPCRAFVAKET